MINITRSKIPITFLAPFIIFISNTPRRFVRVPIVIAWIRSLVTTAPRVKISEDMLLDVLRKTITNAIGGRKILVGVGGGN